MTFPAPSRTAVVLVAAVMLAGCQTTTDSAQDSATATTSTDDTAAATTPPAGTPPTATSLATSTAPDSPATAPMVGETPSVSASQDPAGQQYPDVIAAEATATGDTWQVTATISSPYDTPQRYADAFRVLAPNDDVLGIRELTHDHANEQPFTRSLADVAIPTDVTTITVEGRDQANGWGGASVTIDLPG